MEPQHFIFTYKGNLLRIENTSTRLEPINIIDLEAKNLTIVYPHNTTFVHVDLDKAQTRPNRPALPAMPAGFSSPQLDGTEAIPPNPRAAPAHIGPNISPPPGFPTPPPMPSPPSLNSGVPGMPQMPNASVAGAVGPGAAASGYNAMNPPAPNNLGAPGMAMPPMPSMPGMFSALELKKTDKTKKIQGFDCTLYTITERGQTFEIWASNDSGLCPFRLIERDFIGRRFGPQMLEETWPELLRNKSLFPLEATLKMEPGGQERLTFKIDKIARKKIDQPEADKLFQPPENYIEIQAPQL